MSETPPAAPPVDPPADPVDPPAVVDPPVPGEEALGDPGKKALDRMKAERNTAQAERVAAQEAAAAATAENAALRAQLAEAQAKGETFDLEKAIGEKTAEIAAEYQRKVAVAEIRAAATGQVVDVDLIVSLPEFNPDNFLTPSGEVDQGKVAAAISDLVSTKPYLAAQGPTVKGSGDGGPRNASRPPQLTRTELERMSPQEVSKAFDEGRLTEVLAARPS